MLRMKYLLLPPHLKLHNMKLYKTGILALTIGLASCGGLKQKAAQPSVQLPQQYTPKTDSSLAALPMWKSIYTGQILRQHIDTALRRNFDIRLALQALEASRAGIRFTRGIRLPEVGLAGGSGVRRFGEYTMDGVGNFDTQFSPNLGPEKRVPDPLPDYQVGFVSTWELDIYGKLRNEKQAAVNRFAASEAGRRFVSTQVTADVAGQYLELQASDRELSIIRNSIRLQQEALELVKAQKEAGLANQLAVELMEAQLISTQAFEFDIQGRVAEQEARLNFMLGKTGGQPLRDSLTATLPLTELLRVGVPSDVLRFRTDIQQAERELQAAGADLKAARKALFPSLVINSQLGLQAFNAAFLLNAPASITYNLFGGLTGPLLNRRRLKSMLVRSAAEQKKAVVQYEKTLSNAFREVITAIQKLENMRLAFDRKSRETELLMKAVNTSNELFRVGRAGYLEVITAQKNALSAQIELTELRKRYGLSQVELYRALGGGWQ